MKVQNIKQTILLNFASRKLFNVKLMQSDDLEPYKKINGNIIELDSSDINREDLKREIWEDEIYGKDILDDFARNIKNKKTIPQHESNIRFYAVETVIPGTSNQIISLAEAHIAKQKIILYLLQSLNQFYILRDIKGGGSSLLYAVQQLAEKLQKPRIELRANESAVYFYVQKNGFHNLRGQDYYLPESEFAEFKKRLEEKYSITPVA